MKGVNHSNQTVLGDNVPRSEVGRGGGGGDFVFRDMNYSRMRSFARANALSKFASPRDKRSPPVKKCDARNAHLRDVLYRRMYPALFSSPLCYFSANNKFARIIFRVARALYFTFKNIYRLEGIIGGGMICHWKCREHIMVLSAAMHQATRIS